MSWFSNPSDKLSEFFGGKSEIIDNKSNNNNSGSGDDNPVKMIIEPSESPTDTGAISSGQKSIGDGRYLPSMESLHNTTHEMFPVPFEGLKVVLNQGLNQHFQLNYSWAFGAGDKTQTGWKVGATFVGHQKTSETEIYPVLLGELSPGGALSAQAVHQLGGDGGVRVKYVSQMRPGRGVDGQQLSVEHRARDINLALSIINPSIENKEVSVVVDLMRRLSERLAVGSMFVFQRTSQTQLGNFGVWNVGGQLVSRERIPVGSGGPDGSPEAASSASSNSGHKWTAAVGLRPFQSSFHSTFHMRLNEQFQVGTEIEASLGHRQCVGTAGYQYDLPKAAVTIKSQIDSNWKIATSYERKFVVPIPFSFNISINGDFWKSVYGLGVGFSLL